MSLDFAKIYKKICQLFEVISSKTLPLTVNMTEEGCGCEIDCHFHSSASSGVI